MADIINEGLGLTVEELKIMNPGWPGAMNEDYLSLRRTNEELIAAVEGFDQLIAGLDARIAKLKSMINLVDENIINTTFLKGFAFRLEGQGVSNPLVTVGYNIRSVIRTGKGVYRVTLTQDTFFGFDVIDNALVSNSWNIINDAASDGHFVTLTDVSPGVADITVVNIEQGTGNRIDFNPYDLVAGDFVDIAGMLNVGSGELPPN